MDQINLNDTATMVLILVAVLVLVLTAFVVYLLGLITRVEFTLWRVNRALRPPEVPRNANGHRIRERI